jgi:hypothetical protein
VYESLKKIKNSEIVRKLANENVSELTEVNYIVDW